LFFISRPTAAVQENPRTKLNLARISDAGLFSRSGHETTESVEIDVVDRNRKLRMITRAETFDPELRVGSLAQFCIPKSARSRSFKTSPVGSTTLPRIVLFMTCPSIHACEKGNR
jgi:hypothetical protein